MILKKSTQANNDITGSCYTGEGGGMWLAPYQDLQILSLPAFIIILTIVINSLIS